MVGYGTSAKILTYHGLRQSQSDRPFLSMVLSGVCAKRAHMRHQISFACLAQSWHPSPISQAAGPRDLSRFELDAKKGGAGTNDGARPGRAGAKAGVPDISLFSVPVRTGGELGARGVSACGRRLVSVREGASSAGRAGK